MRYLVWCGGKKKDVADGSPQEATLDRDWAIVREVMEVLRSRHLNREGVFRVPGNSVAISTATGRLEKGEAPSEVLSQLENEEDGVDGLASLLKKWVGRLGCETCPEEIVHFLAEVADNSDANRMPARNLATVFGPIFAPAPDPRQPYDAYVREVLTPSIDGLATSILDAQARRFSETHPVTLSKPKEHTDRPSGVERGAARRAASDEADAGLVVLDPRASSVRPTDDFDEVNADDQLPRTISNQAHLFDAYARPPSSDLVVLPNNNYEPPLLRSRDPPPESALPLRAAASSTTTDRVDDPALVRDIPTNPRQTHISLSPMAGASGDDLFGIGACSCVVGDFQETAADSQDLLSS